tara:strand:- start:270 stop:560 length:291 start_codon:yes stop_codon:yes gene_type:complete
MSFNNILDITNTKEIYNNKKLYYIPKPQKKYIKYWLPNSTGRDIPMTSRFGLENNKYNTFLIRSPSKFSSEIKLPKLKSKINIPTSQYPTKLPQII